MHSGGPYNGIEGVIASDDDLATARKLYAAAAADYPRHVVLLCQSGRILARADEPMNPTRCRNNEPSRAETAGLP